jgi:hypothetical protein
MRKIRTVSCLIMGIFIWQSSYGQQKEKGFELLQLLKISETYKNARNLGFDMDYTYADSASPNTIVEHISGISKASNGFYWTLIDSVEIIQGSQYNLAIYYSDSTIIVNDKKEYGDLLKMEFLDSMFRKSNIDSLSITVVNDSTWQLLALFNPSSGFSQYKLLYDPKTFLVKSMQYYLKEFTDLDTITSGTALIKLTINNYIFSNVDQTLFNENKFIYKQDGQILKKPAFSNYSLINNSVN